MAARIDNETSKSTISKESLAFIRVIVPISSDSETIDDTTATAFAAQTNRTNVAPTDSEKCIKRIHVGRSASPNYHKPQNKANEKSMEQNQTREREKSRKIKLFVHMRSNVMCCGVWL